MRSPRGRLVALALSLTALVAGVPLVTAAPASAAASPGAGAVTLTALDVSPSTPDPSATAGTLTVTFRLRNNTAQDIPGIQITGDRGVPIERQADLDSAMAHPAVPDPGLSAPINSPPTVVDLARGASQDVVFSTTTGIPTGGGICLCANEIYPLYFSATIDRDGKTVTLATAQTYIPSFDVTTPSKVQVAWVWPLLDIPHRSTSSTEFTDDLLAAEVSPGGRLDRALAVVEAVTAASPTPVPMTLLTDPDLIDELEIMAEGSYTVEQATGPPVPGKGTGVAAAWLARLRDVLTQHPSVELDLTSYGDPDVDGLQRDGLNWTTALPASVQAHINTALAGVTTLNDLAWPVGETISRRTLATLTQQGTRTVLLNDKTVPGVASDSTDALAAVSTASGTADIGVLNSSIEAWAARVFVPNGAGQAYLPEFVAQVALHSVVSTIAAQSSAGNSQTGVDESHVVVITPPRLLDVDPTVAARAIIDTSTSVWAQPVMLRDALHSNPPHADSRLVGSTTSSLPFGSATALHFVEDSLPGLSSMFSKTDAESELGMIPTAAQLAASSSLIATSTSDAVGYANRLSQLVAGYRTGVSLVAPTRPYTLTSTRSSIPITVTNTLGVPVYVDLSGYALGGLSGFSATPILSRQIPAHTTVQVRMSTHFERTGRVQVQVSLTTPSALTLSDPITLSVRSTALGTIGVVITVVAGVVLVVALLLRVLRRAQRAQREKARATT